MNWGRGFVRLWIACSVAWLFLCAGLALTNDSYGADGPIVIESGPDHVTYPPHTSQEVIRADLQARVDARNQKARATAPERREKCASYLADKNAKFADRPECIEFLFNDANFAEALDTKWETQYSQYALRKTYLQEAEMIAIWSIGPSLSVLFVGWCIGWVISGFVRVQK